MVKFRLFMEKIFKQVENLVLMQETYYTLLALIMISLTSGGSYDQTIN